MWFIAATVQPAGKEMWTPGHNAWQLWSLVVLYGLQLLFLLTQMPYNERFENVVQTVVAFNQGILPPPPPRLWSPSIKAYCIVLR